MSKLPDEPLHRCLKRSREVKKISSLFTRLNDRHKGHLTAVYLIGPPGSGKTQLARQFGKRFADLKSNDNENRPVVLTINVESLKSLLKSTKEVLHQLKLVEDAPKVEDARMVEDARKLEDTQKVEDAQKVEDTQMVEDARKVEDTRKVEDARKVEEEEARMVGDARTSMEKLRKVLEMYPGKWLFILDNMFDNKGITPSTLGM